MTAGLNLLEAHMKDNRTHLRIAMLSVHSSPMGELGSQDTGGMSVYIRELANELGKTGHIIDIYTRDEKRGLPGEVVLSENVRLIHIPIGGNGHLSKDMVYPHLNDFFRSVEARRIRNDLHYDLIHSHYWLSGVVGCMAQRSWNVPHIIMFHTTGMAKRIHCTEEKEHPLRITTEIKLAHECTGIIAPTKKEKTFLHKYFDVPYEKVGVVPCGVDPEVFHPVQRDLARKELGLDLSAPVVLYVGRFAPIKGIDRLMHAVAYHRMYKRSLKLILAGGDGTDSDASAGLRHQARRLGILDSVIFEGRVPHDTLPVYYSAADALIVPSYYESFGLVALESLACGTPVVATRVGVIDSLVQSSISGEIVDSPNPHSIANALEKVISQQQSSLLSRKAIRAAVLRYAWPNIASAVLDEYSDLLHSDDFGTMVMNYPKQKPWGMSPPLTGGDEGAGEKSSLPLSHTLSRKGRG
ncbi:MAG: glycosyltransferase family 1 protein [Nitrospiraceae bacterium]|nr:MAG: glycosyltransferase family 1 protein [Nitrospiraceae bacterium]